MNGNHKENNVTAKTIFTAMFLAALFLSSGVPSVKAAGPDNSPRVAITQQQKNVVKGKVLDPNGDPIIGASVVVKGSQKGCWDNKLRYVMFSIRVSFGTYNSVVNYSMIYNSND
ncbi:hypothetical protein JHU38_00190 [Prevotella sp. A2931]|uniref:Carboxypeptidase regulatory-like domain-containing protein n=1 Tax=Prevotella illustrans TaxID=2800387 RepID=A0ABS3M226_9BACT|nr:MULTISPECIES: hypothetical protein [Prevotella]MBO1362213.1 hypothetical protein [Prevotella illustrans]